MRRTISAGAAVCMLALGACTVGGGGDSGDPTDGGDTDSADLGTGEDYSVEGALAELPAPEAEEFEVRTADLTAAEELSGLDRPTALDRDEVLPWVGGLTGMPINGSGPGEGAEYGLVPVVLPELTNPRQAQQIEEFDELAGWSLVDVDAFAETVASPPADVAVLTGDFDGSTLDELPTVTGGVRTVGEGPDNDHDLSATSAVSPTGQPIRMAEEDGRLLVSPSTDIASGWLDGQEETTADDPAASALAEALDDSDVVSAQINVGSDFRYKTSSLPGEAAARADQRADDLPDHPFDAVGLGWTAKGDEPVIVVAFHFEDESAAAESVQPLKKVFAEGKDMRGEALSTDLTVSEISSDGPVVTAMLSAERPNAQHSIIRRLAGRDLPFAHR